MIFKYINRLEQVDQLIRQQRTGNAQEFAKKVRLSRRQIYNCLDQLKRLGLEIGYNRDNKTFYYKRNYKVKFSFEVEELSDNESAKNQAGIDVQIKYD